MEICYFEIKNFRGIEHAKLDLRTAPRSSIFAMVGLNESGKTTVLEAINHFSYKQDTLDPLRLPGYSIKDLHSLIPISHRSNFNDIVRFKMEVLLSDEDIKNIYDYAKKNLQFHFTDIGKSIVVEHNLVFKDSKHNKNASSILWYWKKAGRKGKSKKVINLTGDAWFDLVRYVKGMMPSILYFPTFLFDFPEKIYLEGKPGSTDKHAYYRQVVQDVLDALNIGAQLDTHIVRRARSNDPGERKNLDSLLLQMGRHITKTVFGAWNSIFNQQQDDKKIRLEVSTEADGKLFLSVRLEDQDGIYLVSERSLGFRWFFTFLLFTQFRGFRKNGSQDVVFLFDEPASNLHPGAQTQLLKSFENLSKRCSIIYTTHSHHMIDPSRLEATFVVKNLGVRYGAEKDDYSANKTNISVTRYREFASKHPDQTSYFKPILDVLDYQPSLLENVPNVVLVEGKGDFYALRYMREVILDMPKINVLPGTGSGNLHTLIQLYLGWSREFLILLDADSEGKKQSARYLDIFGTVLKERCYLLSSISNSWDGQSVEGLFTENDKLTIQMTCYPSDVRFSKTHFHRALQELYGTKRAVLLSEVTKNNFKAVFEFLLKNLPAREPL